jgi:hypothetical protein
MTQSGIVAVSILMALLISRPIISAIARSAGAFLDMRDLDQVLAHVHDAEIEIGEGPEPPAREGPLQ